MYCNGYFDTLLYPYYVHVLIYHDMMVTLEKFGAWPWFDDRRELLYFYQKYHSFREEIFIILMPALFCNNISFPAISWYISIFLFLPLMIYVILLLGKNISWYYSTCNFLESFMISVSNRFNEMFFQKHYELQMTIISL